MLIDLLGDEFRYELYICKPLTYVAYSPTYTIVGCLSSCAYNFTIKKQMQNINEISFDIGMYWNDIGRTENPYFDMINAGMMIKLETYVDEDAKSFEYFYIYQTDLTGVEKEIKSVKCYSSQYKWNKIKIRNFTSSDTFVTTRKLYDGQTFDAADSTKGGILDYILQEKLYNTWTVSYMTYSLYNKYRTFDISEQSLMDVVHTIEGMYNCVFFFDTALHEISIYAYYELPEETGLIINDSNYLKQLSQQIKVDEIITRMYPEGKSPLSGGGTMSISGYSITCQAYIDNFSYFRTSTYMSPGLLLALTNHDAHLISHATDHANYLLSKTTHNAELDVLVNDLFDYNTNLLLLQNYHTACIRTRQDVEGHNYAYWQAQVVTQEAMIVSKEAEITAKEAEIAADQYNLTQLGAHLSYSNTNYFTTNELQELLQFINEETVKFDTEDVHELYDLGVELLAIKATPPIEFSLDMIDIFSCKSENYTWTKLTLGSLVDLEFEDFNISSKPRIVEYTHSPDSNSLSITVSNRTYFNDPLQYVSNVFADSRKTATVVENERDTYKEYSTDKPTIVYTGEIIETTSNEITNEDGTLLLDRRGIFMKRIESTPTGGQFRLFDDCLLATRDNWDTYSVAITSNGVQCDDLWVLTNTDGSCRITGTTIEIFNMMLDMQTDSNLNRIQIDPTLGIVVSQGSTPVFYTDTDGLVYAKQLYLEATSTGNIIEVNPDIGIRIGTNVVGATPLLWATPSGDLYLQNVFIGNDLGNVSISPTGLVIKNGNGSETILDEFGIDPRYLDYYKNMVINSSFECFDAGTKLPTYWSAGESTASSSFHGSYSLKLVAGETSIQVAPSWMAGIVLDPAWWENLVTRVSFYRKLGEVTVAIKDLTDSSYFTLTDENGATGSSVTFGTTASWVDSRASFTFDPTEHPTCNNLAIEFTNSHFSAACYIDAVQLCPDFTGKWSQLYKDGQYSIGVNSIGDLPSTVATFG
jgi:hypothetical protein